MHYLTERFLKQVLIWSVITCFKNRSPVFAIFISRIKEICWSRHNQRVEALNSPSRRGWSNRTDTAIEYYTESFSKVSEPNIAFSFCYSNLYIQIMKVHLFTKQYSEILKFELQANIRSIKLSEKTFKFSFGLIFVQIYTQFFCPYLWKIAICSWYPEVATYLPLTMWPQLGEFSLGGKTFTGNKIRAKRKSIHSLSKELSIETCWAHWISIWILEKLTKIES